MSTYYTCRIDTNEYSGNFEREMVAFITGQVGECGVGEENAALAEKQLPKIVTEWFSENTIFTPDEDNGCSRPAEIVPTPGWSNDGMGKHTKGEGKYPAYQSVQMRFEVKPPEYIQELISGRAKVFPARGVDRFGSLKKLEITDVVFEEVKVKTTKRRV
jgi:hypothetical protein